MKFDFKVNLWTILVIGIIVFGAFKWKSLKNEIDKWTNNYEIALEGKEQMAVWVSSLDSALVATKRSYEMTNKELKDALKSDSIQRELVKKYKAAAAVVKIEWKFHPQDTVFLPIPNDTSVHVTHECFEVDLSASNGLLSLANLTVDNRQDIILGQRKSGLWKTEQAIDIRNTNPCIRTTGITSYTVVVKKHWYEKWWITLPAGFATGYVAGTLNR